jgi:hypothetical protein
LFAYQGLHGTVFVNHELEKIGVLMWYGSHFAADVITIVSLGVEFLCTQFAGD